MKYPQIQLAFQIYLSFLRMLDIQGVMDTGPHKSAFSLLSRKAHREAAPGPPPPPGRSGKETVAAPTSTPGTLHPVAPRFLKFPPAHTVPEAPNLPPARSILGRSAWSRLRGGGASRAAESRWGRGEAEEAGPPGSLVKANGGRSLPGRTS